MGPLSVRLCGAVDSTQRELWAKRRWAQEGTGIAASSQTAGVGRGGHEWVSPVGGVYLSVLGGRALAAADGDVLNEAAALAVLKTCREILPQAAFWLKWPNDVVVRGRGRVPHKVAGVLVRTEVEGDHLAQGLIGVGLNVRDALPPRAGRYAASLEGLAKATRTPWGATRVRALEWLVGWLAIELGNARTEPAAVREEFGREVARGALHARVAGTREDLKPLRVERGGVLVVRRRQGETATVSVADSDRLTWSFLPASPPKRKGPSAAKGVARARRPRSSRARSGRSARRSR